MEFKVGDKVYAFGVEGEVFEIKEGALYPVYVRLKDTDDIVTFSMDGRHSAWHKEPNLKLRERPKKKVTKTIEAWTNVYPEGYMGLYTTERSANIRVGRKKIACVKLTGTYEVEEE